MKKNTSYTFKKKYKRIWNDIQKVKANKELKKTGKILLSLRDVANKWHTSVETISNIEAKYTKEISK